MFTSFFDKEIKEGNIAKMIAFLKIITISRMGQKNKND